MLALQDFPSGETSSIPGTSVPLAAENCSAINGAFPYSYCLIRVMRAPLARPAENRLA